MKTEIRLHYTLRVAIAMCFIGHGSFGMITKEIWCNYFAVFGIGKVMAYTLMPWLGSFDILMGLIILIYPVRAIALWLLMWATITAALRPLSGEPFAELIERAGNFGVPLAFLILNGGIGSWKQLFTKVEPNVQVSARTLYLVTQCLTVIVCLLLIGHGWLNLLQKKGLLAQYASLGFSHPGKVAILAGFFEIAAAITVLVKPVANVLLFLLVWKMATELVYPHYEIFEWVERGGSYGAILALWFIAKQQASPFITNRLLKSWRRTNVG